MRRTWLSLLPVLLLLSLGFNIGLLASMRVRPSRSWLEPPSVEQPARADRAGRADRNRRRVSSEARVTLEGLANRMDLRGGPRARFLRLQRELQRSLRQQLPDLQQTRRELYREVESPLPDQERLRHLTERMARKSVEIEHRLVRTVVESRKLLDRRQDEIYLRFVGARFHFLRDTLSPAAGRPPSLGAGTTTEAGEPTPR